LSFLRDDLTLEEEREVAFPFGAPAMSVRSRGQHQALLIHEGRDEVLPGQPVLPQQHTNMFAKLINNKIDKSSAWLS
jgi:hypothetical protein